MYTHYGKTTISAQLKHLETFSNPIKPYGVIYNPINQTDITDEIKNKYVVKECEAVKHNYFIILQRGDISKESEADRWIPVSERLPEEKINPNTEDLEEVLCSTIWGDVRAYKFGKPIHFDKPHFWYACGIMDKYVTHWQYLPEPYKESEAENEC